MPKKLLKPLELRVSDLQIRSEDKQNFIDGTITVYNTPSTVGGAYDEQFKPSCWAKSLREAARTLPLLWAHNRDRVPLGSLVEWWDTGEKLDGSWLLSKAHPDNENIYISAQEGHLTGLSVGFVPIQSVWDWAPEGETRADLVTRVECALYEVSITPLPVHGGSKITHVRTSEGRDRTPRATMWRKYLENLR